MRPLDGVFPHFGEKTCASVRPAHPAFLPLGRGINTSKIGAVTIRKTRHTKIESAYKMSVNPCRAGPAG